MKLIYPNIYNRISFKSFAEFQEVVQTVDRWFFDGEKVVGKFEYREMGLRQNVTYKEHRYQLFSLIEEVFWFADETTSETHWNCAKSLFLQEPQVNYLLGLSDPESAVGRLARHPLFDRHILLREIFAFIPQLSKQP